ncbi:Uncharacterised protein [Vibrio cholerae]|nr:Uncharacterised protein [Vibrio cholerae]
MHLANPIFLATANDHSSLIHHIDVVADDRHGAIDNLLR